MYMIPIECNDDQGPYIRAYSVLLRNTGKEIQNGEPSQPWEEYLCTYQNLKEITPVIEATYQDFVVISIREIQVRIWDER